MKKFFEIAVLVLTVFRIWLAVKLPVYIQGDAIYDDFLFVKYALNLLQGNWLGDFDSTVLSKSAAFSFFLAGIFTLGIPYSLALILLWIFATALLAWSLKSFIDNKKFLYVMYIFLLYSPVMFHEENIQKIYRNGLIVVFTVIVIAAFIFLSAKILENKFSFLKFSIFAGLSLSFFWLLKEDSIWIMPFVLTIIFYSGISIFKSRKEDWKIRLIILFLPLVILIFSIETYSLKNYLNYGQFAVTDRTGTYQKEFLADLISIEDAHELQHVWITKSMIQKAENVSPSFRELKIDIKKSPSFKAGENFVNLLDDESYMNSAEGLEFLFRLGLNDKSREELKNIIHNEIRGDIIYWAFKEEFERVGLYSKSGKDTDAYFKKIHEELTEAFNNGSLKKSEGNYISISSSARGFTPTQIKNYFFDVALTDYRHLLRYEKNKTTANSAWGNHENIVLMAELTNSFMLWENPGQIKIFADRIVSIAEKIVKIYQKTGYIVAILGVIGIFI